MYLVPNATGVCARTSRSVLNVGNGIANYPEDTAHDTMVLLKGHPLQRTPSLQRTQFLAASIVNAFYASSPKKGHLSNVDRII